MDHPTGTVTLVFTDVQGSAELWDRLGDRFGALLGQHNDLLRRLIGAHDGYEVKTEGDSFMIAFAEARDGLAFALEVQDQVDRMSWCEAGVEIRVRMGMHTGAPLCQEDPTTGRMDYFGPMVNRAARIAAAGHGGQVLISQATLDAGGGALDAHGAEVIDLGEHRFKGLSRSEHVHQVLPSRLAGRRYPKLATLDEIPTNLPDLVTTFVGRERECGDVAAMVLDGSARLVTLTGPGGVGKTRLAHRVANEVLDRFEGGVWFVDLTEAWGTDAVCSAIASAFSVPLPGGQSPVEAIGALLEFRKPLVIVLDNFEQLVDHARDTIGCWLRGAPHVRFLVTSRSTLGLSGEREYQLEPLAAPDPGSVSLEEAGSLDVVRLFMERAREARPGFALDERNALDVVRICSALEGMPLAIELAAARIRLMSPSQMVRRLGRMFELLRSTRRDLPARQQTLTGAIDWSYDLLDDWEKAAFCQACAFRGGFFVEAAEEVIDLSMHPGAPSGMDAVEALREHSLLATSETPLGTRFRMYVAIREYAEARVADVLDDAQRRRLEARHAEFYLRYAEQWDHRRGTDEAVEAFDRLEMDAENLFAVDDRAVVANDPSRSARAVLAMSTTMAIRGPSAERIPRLERALAGVSGSVAGDRHLEARLMTALCLACQDRGDWDRASEVADRALELADSLGADRERGNALIQRGEMQRLRGDLDRAQECFGLAVDVFERIDDRPGQARSIGGLGSVLWKRGRYDEAIEHFTRAAEIFEVEGNIAGRARNVGGRGIILRELHDYDSAIRCYEEAESMHRLLRNRLQLAQTIGNRALVLFDQGEYDKAMRCLDEAERINREIGNKANVARNVGIRGQVLEGLGRHEEALASFGQAEAMHRELGNRDGIAINVARRGRCLLRLSRAGEAAQALDEALELFRDIGEGKTRDAFECAADLARARSMCGEAESATHAAREALDVAGATGLVGATFDGKLMDQLSALRKLAGV